MAELREVRRRIRSVENTRKITRAMEMVSGAKLKQLETAAAGARPYTEGLKQLLARLLAEKPDLKHPLFEKRGPVKRSALICVTSDTGLCGSYNSELITEAERFVELRGAKNIDLIAVGFFGAEYFKHNGIMPHAEFIDFKARVEDENVARVLDAATGLFMSRRVEEVVIVSCGFRSASSFAPRRMRILPDYVSFARPGSTDASPPPESGPEGRKAFAFGKDSGGGAYPSLLEPDSRRVFDVLVPRYLQGQLRQVLLEAYSAEQSARMMAMRNATENADEMIKDLTLKRNKARQAQITTDIIEVVSGAEGLKQ